MNEQLEPTEAQKSKQIVCPSCTQHFAPGDFTRLDVKGHPGLKNVGLSCPHCGWFGHCFVEDMRVRRRRATVDIRRQDFGRNRTRGNYNQVVKAQANLRRVFDEVQAKWRPILGLVPVWQVDIETEPV